MTRERRGRCEGRVEADEWVIPEGAPRCQGGFLAHFPAGRVACGRAELGAGVKARPGGGRPRQRPEGLDAGPVRRMLFSASEAVVRVSPTLV
jgi:hypothetical protein